MPRFSQADEAVLKRTMLPRAPTYYFTPEDTELCTKETEKKKEDIQHWARQFRWRASINSLPGGLSAEEYLKASPESLDDKTEKVNVKRCYVSMFNTNEKLVENFSIPKPRGSVDYSIQFQCFAWNQDTLVAEGFLDFNDQIYTTTIHERLAELGARSIGVMTFQNNDGNHSAASALNRVRTVAKSEGFTEVVRGTCNAKLLAKADELLAAEKLGKSAEFDEKTQAAMKLSLEMTEEIKSTMATREGLSHLQEITQMNAEEIKCTFVRFDESIKGTIIKQQAIIAAHQDANEKLNHHLIILDKKLMERDEKINSQAYIINKLNDEARKRDEKISQLHTVIEKKNQELLTGRQNSTNNQRAASETQEASLAILSQCKDLLEELKADRKRKHDE